MRNMFLYVCGKPVESRGKQHRTTRVQSSTPHSTTTSTIARLWVKAQLIPESFPTVLLGISTASYRRLPLVIHQLSPVSTVPITRTTKMKFKKG